MSNHRKEKAKAHAEGTANAAKAADLPVVATECKKRLRNLAVPHADLAAKAHEAGFPAIHLPGRTSEEVAFGRACEAAVRNLSHPFVHRWRADRVGKDDLTVDVLLQEQDIDSHGKDGKAIWIPRITATLVRPVRTLTETISDPAIFFDPDPGDDEAPWEDGLDRDAAKAMCRRVMEQYVLQRDNAVTSEINDAIEAALLAAGGLRVIPQVWILPGGHGAERAKAAGRLVELLDPEGGSSLCWTTPLLDTPEQADMAGRLAKAGVLSEVEEVVLSVTEACEGGKASVLRSRLSEIRALEVRLKAWTELEAAAVSEASARFEELRKLIDKANVKDDDLDIQITQHAADEMRAALVSIREAAKDRSPDALRKAVPALAENLRRSRHTSFGTMWKALLGKASETAIPQHAQDWEFESLAQAAKEVAHAASADLGDDFADIG